MNSGDDNIFTDLQKAAATSGPAIEADPPPLNQTGRTARQLIFLIILGAFIIIALVWASRAEVETVVRGPGQVIPDSSKQIIQSLEGGIIKNIPVTEGQKVAAGDIILELDDKRYSAFHEGNVATRDAILARMARLQAEIKGADKIEFPPGLTDPEARHAEEELFNGRREDHLTKLRFKERLLAKENERFDASRSAFRSGALPVTERIARESEILKLEEEVNTLKTTFKREALENYDRARERLTTLVQTMKADEDRMVRTVIRSPIDGVVNRILISTIGRVVAGGEPIMEIIPQNDQLVIEAKIRPADIAFLYQDQNVKVNFTAFDFSIYGGLDGKVKTIGVDTVYDEATQESYYPVKITTESDSLGVDPKTGQKLDLVPGMIADVNILTGKRTILNYLLKPINKAKRQALREP
ncbi:MAG: HlyD family type I secretion periplasmic adaptor subunit [Verrucomicrobiales bacterium]|nr:HlyD family type I secretion periplasmic adaptor subunit [Verrucomicrobiales bacterium]